MKRFFALTLLSLFLAACSGEAPFGGQPSETPTRAKATKTHQPTVTFTPAPPPSVTDALDGVIVKYTYGFDGLMSSDWPLENSYVSEAGGVLELAGHDWQGVQWAGDVRDYQAILISFRYVQGSIFEAYLQSGPFNSKEYRRYGVTIADKTVRTNIWRGTALFIDKRIAGTLTLKADHWYQLLLAIAPQGSFLTVIGDADEPGNRLRFADNLGDQWTGLIWNFKVGGQRGTADFDDFAQLNFTAFK